MHHLFRELFFILCFKERPSALLCHSPGEFILSSSVLLKQNHNFVREVLVLQRKERMAAGWCTGCNSASLGLCQLVQIRVNREQENCVVQVSIAIPSLVSAACPYCARQPLYPTQQSTLGLTAKTELLASESSYHCKAKNSSCCDIPYLPVKMLQQKAAEQFLVASCSDNFLLSENFGVSGLHWYCSCICEILVSF